MIEENKVFCGDNLNVLKAIPFATVKLVYLDPPLLGSDFNELPFNSPDELGRLCKHYAA